MRTRSSIGALVVVAAALSYTTGSPRMPGNSGKQPKSGPCPCGQGMLHRGRDGMYRCRQCLRECARLPKKP